MWSRRHHREVHGSGYKAGHDAGDPYAAADVVETRWRTASLDEVVHFQIDAIRFAHGRLGVPGILT
jgi:hypothetical protein